MSKIKVIIFGIVFISIICLIMIIVILRRSSKLKEKEKLVEYLKNNINTQISLESIVETFENMCQNEIKDDMILYETGTYYFEGEQFFYFSLVRQFPNDEEEFYQIHVDVLYEPDNYNKTFNKAVWNTDLSENIFDYIHNSQAFEYVKNKEYVKVNIYMDET